MYPGCSLRTSIRVSSQDWQRDWLYTTSARARHNQELWWQQLCQLQQSNCTYLRLSHSRRYDFFDDINKRFLYITWLDTFRNSITATRVSQVLDPSAFRGQHISTDTIFVHQVHIRCDGHFLKIWKRNGISWIYLKLKQGINNPLYWSILNGANGKNAIEFFIKILVIKESTEMKQKRTMINFWWRKDEEWRNDIL